jgi:phenylalanyl-tRNA synthetase alpha chain
MTGLPKKIEQLSQAALKGLQEVKNASALEQWRIQYLGRKGEVPLLLRTIKDLSAQDRKTVGQKANQLRRELQEEYEKKAESVKGVESTEVISTKHSVSKGRGHLHPLLLTTRRIQDIFATMGFLIVDGPEVEEPEYNFDYLNISPEHPARAETDTFYLTNGKILRTHVSPIQIRAVEDHTLKPPFKILYYGRCFRAERTDATHETTFNQFEFLVVNKEATIADFKGVIETFYSTFFGKAVHVRLRPSYFPFVEPGFETDLSCVFCQGQGCRVCKYTGWIEIGGAGMVHPEVLKNMKLDPTEYQGFACGSAVDRLAMLYYGINDIRLFWSGDIRFLKQFS